MAGNPCDACFLLIVLYESSGNHDRSDESECDPTTNVGYSDRWIL